MANLEKMAWLSKTGPLMVRDMTREQLLEMISDLVDDNEQMRADHQNTLETWRAFSSLRNAQN